MERFILDGLASFIQGLDKEPLPLYKRGSTAKDDEKDRRRQKINERAAQLVEEFFQ